MSEITPEERASWRERLTSKFSCFDAELGGFTLQLIDAFEAAEAERKKDIAHCKFEFDRAEKAEADAEEWKEQIPEECPITGLPYFNSFKNSAGVYQPFYGGPCDVYGIPYKDEDGYLCRKHLCLDSMREEDESMCLEVVEEERMIDLGEAEAQVPRLLDYKDAAEFEAIVSAKIAKVGDDFPCNHGEHMYCPNPQIKGMECAKPWCLLRIARIEAEAEINEEAARKAVDAGEE